MRFLLPVVLVLSLLAGCDPQARSEGGIAAASASGVARAAVGGALSRAYESCATSTDCEDGLRCRDQVCRPADTSRLGEYYWAAGQAALDRGQVSTAAEALQKGLARFEADKVEVPPGLLCDYGAALRRNTGDAKAAEQAARLLHRCLLSAPAGTLEHARALRELVDLEAQGLDPTLLQRDTPADTYLVGAPKRPDADALKVDVAATQAARDRGYDGWFKLLSGPAARKAMLPCFEQYWSGSRRPKLSVLMPLRLRARLGDDDEYLGGTLEIGPDPGATGAEATAGECVRQALKPLATEFGKSGSDASWSGTVTLTLSVP